MKNGLVLFCFLLFAVHCTLPVSAQRAKDPLPRCYFYARAIHSRGADIIEITPEGEVKKENRPRRYQYFLYLQTNTGHQPAITSLLLGGQAVPASVRKVKSPVFVTGSVNERRICLVPEGRDPLFQVEALPKKTTSPAPVSTPHRVVIKGKINGKPFVVSDTVTLLPPLIAQ